MAGELDRLPKSVREYIVQRHYGKRGGTHKFALSSAGPEMTTEQFMVHLREKFPVHLEALTDTVLRHAISEVLIAAGLRARSHGKKDRKLDTVVLYQQTVQLKKGGRVIVKSEHPFELKVEQD